MKCKYKGTFNWYGEINTFYTTAVSYKQAKAILFKKISNHVGRSLSSIYSYYNGAVDNYNIKEVI